MSRKLHNFLKELFRSKFSPFFQVFETVSNSVFELGVLYTELVQNNAGIVFTAHWSFAVN